MGFFKDLEVQVMDLQSENEDLEMMMDTLKGDDNRLNQYLYEMTRLHLKQNQEMIQLFLDILKDNEKNTGMYKN